MQHLTVDPDLGTLILWSPRNRKGSKVAITGVLPLQRDTVRCTLILSRETLARHVADLQNTFPYPLLAVLAAIAVWQVVTQGAPSRKRELSLELQPTKARLKFHRTARYAFARFFAGAPPYAAELDDQARQEWAQGFEERVKTLPAVQRKVHALSPAPPWPHLERLTAIIAFFLLSSRVLPSIVHPPRGRAAKVAALTAEIPPALFACKELAQSALAEARQGKPELVARIGRVIKTDQEARIYCQQYRFTPQAVAVALVHRKFRAAWMQTGHPGLSGKARRDVFRIYGYNKGQRKRLAQMVRKAAPAYPYHTLLDIWATMYL